MQLDVYIKGEHTDVLTSLAIKNVEDYSSIDDIFLDLQESLVDSMKYTLKFPFDMELSKELPSFCYTKNSEPTDFLFDYLDLYPEEQQIVYVYNRYVDSYVSDVQEILSKCRGFWDSTEDFTEELLRDIYGTEIESLPPLLQYAIDYSIAARDLFISDYVYVPEFKLVYEAY